MMKKPSTRKAPAPKAPAISAPITVDAGDWTQDAAPLGAHVSIAGGTWEAAARAREISATAAQLFTKQANRWMERDITPDEAARFRAMMAETRVRWMCAHDSYLINLASPDSELRARSIDSFAAELRRCHALGLDALVSHPGNFMDDRASGLDRNAAGITEALEREPGPTRLLMELTAGQGTVLGSTFDEMAALLDKLPASVRGRVGVCLDTAHIWAAGYDLTTAYDAVWQQFGDILGFPALGCLHLNDSKAKLGSHLDRHELIGEGTIGGAVFHQIMTDTRLKDIPKIIETPKGDTPAVSDGRMLRLLRQYAATAAHALLVGLGLATAGATAITATPRVAQAQTSAADEAPVRWSGVQEVAGWFASTWLSGSRAPTVSSKAGGALAIGLQRPFRHDATIGVLLRAAEQPLTLSEAGASWSGGSVREVDMVGSWSSLARPMGRYALHLDALGGVAVLAGAAEILPFRDAGLVAPTGEIGVHVARRPADEMPEGVPPRRQMALFARVGGLRLGTTAANAIASSGWVTRFSIGLRSTR